MGLFSSGWVYFYILFAIYIMYRIFFKRDPHQREYEKMYHEIVHSDKYKTKGQWK